MTVTELKSICEEYGFIAVFTSYDSVVFYNVNCPNFDSTISSPLLPLNRLPNITRPELEEILITGVVEGM